VKTSGVSFGSRKPRRTWLRSIVASSGVRPNPLAALGRVTTAHSSMRICGVTSKMDALMFQTTNGKPTKAIFRIGRQCPSQNNIRIGKAVVHILSSESVSLSNAEFGRLPQPRPISASSSIYFSNSSSLRVSYSGVAFQSSSSSSMGETAFSSGSFGTRSFRTSSTGCCLYLVTVKV